MDRLYISKEIIKEWIQTEFHNFINEISISTNFPDDGPNFFFPSFSAFEKISKERAEELGYTVFKQIMTNDLEDYYEHPRYPNGPVRAVTPFPAGVEGELTATNQVDTDDVRAHRLWFNHVTRSMALAGYSLIQFNFTKDPNRKYIKYTIKEDITTPSVSKSFLSQYEVDEITTDILKELYDMMLIEDIKYLPNSLNIPRSKMPQIKSTDVRDYLSYLEKLGVRYTTKKVVVSKLKPTQKEINTDKVKSLMGSEISNLSKPVIVSNDMYILDGHHRVFALYNLGKNNKINIIKVDVPIKKLLELTHEYSKSFAKSVDEKIDVNEYNRVVFYENYYKNLTPSDWVVESVGNDIVITIPNDKKNFIEEKFSYARLVKEGQSMLEKSYSGNLGFEEMMKFYDIAPKSLVIKVEDLINKNRVKDAWKIIQKTIGVKLKGKQFETLIENTDIKDVVVVYPGRFQPFHQGHYDSYSHLVKKFGKNNVYIGTSNKTDKVKSPFNFKEKVDIMTTLFGIPKSNIVMVKNPYAPTEILKKYNETTTAFVTVVGEKDAGRLGGKYFTPYNDNMDTGYKEKGYVYVTPTGGAGLSGTRVRELLSNGSVEDRKTQFIKIYPKYVERIFNLIIKRLDEIK